VELVLGVIILTEVRVFIGEFVEILNELLEDFLFIVETVQEFKEVGLNVGVFNLDLLSVETHVLEDSSHLSAVVLAHVLPDPEDDGLEDALNVVTARRSNVGHLRSSTHNGGAAILNHRLSGLIVGQGSGLLLASLVYGDVRLRGVHDSGLIVSADSGGARYGSVGFFLLLSLFLLGALLLFDHRLDFEFKVLPLLLGLLGLVSHDLVNDLGDLGLYVGLLGIAINDLHKDAVLVLNSELLEPAAERSTLLIKRYKTVHESRDSVILTNLLLESFA